MATWNQLTKGKRARRTVHMPLGGAPLPSLVGADGQLQSAVMAESTVAIALRVLTPGEQSDVLSRARADAKAKGVEEPRDGNPIYDLAEMEHTLLLASLDPDSPDDNPRPFFSSITEIRTSPELTRDHVAYLFELHQQHQDECAPLRQNVAIDEVMASLLVLASDDEGEARLFFDSLGPALRWIFMRTLARLWSNSPTPKSSPGSPSVTKEPALPARPQPQGPAPTPTSPETR